MIFHAIILSSIAFSLGAFIYCVCSEIKLRRELNIKTAFKWGFK